MSPRFDSATAAAPWLAVRVLASVLILLLGSCGYLGDRRAPEVMQPRLPEAPPEPELAELPPARPAAPPVALVLSARTVHYRSVADALERRLPGRSVRYVVDGADAETFLGRLADGGHRRAIAIGRDALEVLATSGLTVAYCQVFDPGETAGPGSRGVETLPAYGAQLDAWRERRPELTRIGLITGPGLEQVTDELTAAARARGLTVMSAVVHSDQALLYRFRRMVPEIQGFLLYPDARVLSPGALRAMLAYAHKHEVEVLTYNRSIFDLGADLLVAADPEEIAEQAIAALDAKTPAVLPLSRVVMQARGTTPVEGR